MGNARVGCRIPVNTNLTHPELGHLILGPFNIPAANTTIYTNFLVNIDTTGTDLAVNTPKTRPSGFVIYDPDYEWGTTTPGHFTLIPSEIQVYICAWGCGILGVDSDDVEDAAYIGNNVYDSAVAGICACPPSAAAYGDTDLDDAGYIVIGQQLDYVAGNTGTGTGGADNDPIEVFFGHAPNPAVST